MSEIVGECSKHPGFNMVNCPKCKQEIGRRLFRNILCPTYVITTWGAVLKLEEINKSKGLVRVSDPKAIDAGQYIGINEIQLMARKKI